ncbi:hypothetical protein KY363_04980 [Candidatus Woesearchaeota archaeon]|nr:hypothetical protein [Candidatus Woesearchaeota archaeon]
MIEDRIKINGRRPRSRIVTASGCRATTLETILRYSKDIPQIGVFTTKSIGPRPNHGNPAPIYCSAPEHGPRARRNAVGLANPGHDYFSHELAVLRARCPDLNGALLLGSVYGADKDDFVAVAKALAPYVDGFEANFSCPHAKGFGLDTGRDGDAMAGITAAVIRETGRDVFVKLSPNLADDDLAYSAKACVSAGARGVTVINTVGPGESYLPGTGTHVLFNKVGGLSGPSVLKRGLECVRNVRRATGPEPVIVGMGGIFTGADARSYLEAGADLVGIGTSMEGFTSGGLAHYVAALESDIRDGTDAAASLLPEVDLGFRQFRIAGISEKTDDLRVFYLDGSLDSVRPAQYVFLAVPGSDGHPTMEAPLSVPLNNPLALAVRRHPRKDREHHFTSRLWEQEKGGTVFVRGPYGVPFDLVPGQHLCLVGGGTGVAALTSIARACEDAGGVYRFYMGAKSARELLFLGDLNDSVQCATDDGSKGTYPGFVTDMFEKYGDGRMAGFNRIVTCGPVQMMQKVVESANRKGFPDRDIYVILEPYMKCGVGICGCCSLPDGSVSCTDGHIVTADAFKRYIAIGKVKRDSTGGWENG